MANKKKKKQQSLGTASARAEKVASKKQTTAKSSNVVAKNSPFSKASQQTAKPKQQTQPKPKQTAPAPKQTGPSVRSSATQNKATVEKRIESTAKQQRKNWNQAAKAYDKKNGSASTRIAKASKELTKSKDDLYNKGGNYGKYMYNTLENEVYTKAKNHAGDADYKKLIKDSDFTKEQKAEIKTLHGEHLKGLDKSASFDLDKSAFQSTFEKWKESSQSPKKKKKKEQAAVSDALGNVEGKRESVAAKAQSEKEQKTAKGKARTAFEVADADFRIAESNANDAMEAVKNAFKVAEEDPTEENIAAYNALYAQGEQAYNDYVLAADNAQKAQVAFEKQMRYGKGNIDLMNLPKDDKGRTMAFDLGENKTEYSVDISNGVALINKKQGGKTFVHKDEDGQYVLIPNYVQTDDGWQALSGEDEAWKAYQQSGKHFGKFKSEEEALAYLDELRDTQKDAMRTVYGTQLSEYNDLKAEEKKAKKAMKAARNEYQELATSGASKEEVASAKKKADDALKAFEAASDAKDKYKAEHPDVQTDWAGLTENTLRAGATELVYEAAGFAELVANAFDKDNDNGVSRLAEALGKKREEQSEFGQYLAGDSKLAQGMNMFGPSIVAMVPMMAASIFGSAGEAMTTAEGLSRSGHIAKATQLLAKNAAIEAGQVGKAEALLANIAHGMWTYAHDPSFNSSFVQVTGGTYADAVENGYTEGQAISQALINGYLASIIEVGELGEVKLFGGVNNFNKMRRLLAEGKFGELYKTVVMSPGGEALEEISQGMLERGLQNLTAGKHNPLYSAEDPNAIINPNTMKQEAMGGFLGGLVMGGGIGGAVAGYNAVQNARYNFYNSVIGQATSQYQSVLDTLAQFDPESQSYKMAESYMKRLEEAGLTKKGENGKFEAPEGADPKALLRTISKKEIGELERQKVLDSAQYFLGDNPETGTTRGVSAFAQTLSENARRSSENMQGDTKEKTAHQFDKTLRELVATGGVVETDEKGKTTSGVTDERLTEELNQWQYNEPGFKNTINQFLGAEVLTDDVATPENIVAALRERAAQMHEQTIELADMAKQRVMTELSDEEEADEAAQELASQAMGEAVSEQVEAETLAQENAEVLEEMDEDFASLAASEPPVEPGSIADVARQTEQRRVDEKENAKFTEDNITLLEKEADRLENEGKMKEAKDFRDEAERLRRRSQYTDGEARVEINGKDYTEQELYEYFRNSPNSEGKTDEEVRLNAQEVFEAARMQEEGSTSESRNALLNDYTDVSGAENVRVDVVGGVFPNEVQTIMGNLLAAIAKKRGFKSIQFVSDAELGGAAADYLDDVIKLNVEKLTTQALIEKELGHEFFHYGSDIMARLAGKTLSSKEGDELTKKITKNFQDAALALYNSDPTNSAYAALKIKYVDDYEDLLDRRYNAYTAHRLAKWARDHGKTVPFDSDGRIDVEALRKIVPGTKQEEIKNDLEDNDWAYVRQEIAADWMGEIASQQGLLERLAEDKPGMVYSLMMTARRMRTRLAGYAVPIGNFQILTQSRTFGAALDEITEKLAKELRKANELQVQTIEENGGKATLSSILRSEARQSLPTRNTSQYQTALRRYKNTLEQARREGNLEKVAYMEGGIPHIVGSGEYDQADRDRWFDTPPRERTREHLPYELRSDDPEFMMESWEYQVDAIADPEYGYEDFGPENYVIIPRTPIKKAEAIGININESMSSPASTVMNNLGHLVTDIHTDAHVLPDDATRKQPQWMNEAIFIANNPDKHPGLGNNKKTGKPYPVGVRFYSPHMDKEGHIIAYTMIPDVDTEATVHGIPGIVTNSTPTAFSRPNFFGEYSAYDRLLKQEEKKIDQSTVLTPEEKKKAHADLQKYYSTNQLKKLFEPGPDGRAQTTPQALGLKPKRYNKEGKERKFWQETGTLADSIRSADSLYFELKNAQKFADEMSKFWTNKWAQWLDQAQQNGDEWMPPPPKRIIVPKKLLRDRGLNAEGYHYHKYIPAWSSQNGVDEDRRNGRYAGYTMTHKDGVIRPGTISIDELTKMSASKLENQSEKEGRYGLLDDDIYTGPRPFIATHSQRTAEGMIRDLLADESPAESAGIVPPKLGFAPGFGNIVSFLNRAAVDPAVDKRNVIDAGDDWSPMRGKLYSGHPVQYIMTDKDANNFESHMRELANSLYANNPEYNPWTDNDEHMWTKNAPMWGPGDYSSPENNWRVEGLLALAPDGEKDHRSWHKLRVARPDKYANNAIKRNTNGTGIRFFVDAYLADNGFTIPRQESEDMMDEARANYLMVMEDRAAQDIDTPTLTEWLAKQYANYLSAYGRPKTWVEEGYSVKDPDPYPDDPMASFWSDNMEVNEANDMKTLYKGGDRSLDVPGEVFNNMTALIAAGKRRFQSIDEARDERYYNTLRANKEHYHTLGQRALEKTGDATFEIFKDLVNRDFPHLRNERDQADLIDHFINYDPWDYITVSPETLGQPPKKNILYQDPLLQKYSYTTYNDFGDVLVSDPETGEVLYEVDESGDIFKDYTESEKSAKPTVGLSNHLVQSIFKESDNYIPIQDLPGYDEHVVHYPPESDPHGFSFVIDDSFDDLPNAHVLGIVDNTDGVKLDASALSLPQQAALDNIWYDYVTEMEFKPEADSIEDYMLKHKNVSEEGYEGGESVGQEVGTKVEAKAEAEAEVEEGEEEDVAPAGVKDLLDLIGMDDSDFNDEFVYEDEDTEPDWEELETPSTAITFQPYTDHVLDNDNVEEDDDIAYEDDVVGDIDFSSFEEDQYTDYSSNTDQYNYSNVPRLTTLDDANAKARDIITDILKTGNGNRETMLKYIEKAYPGLSEKTIQKIIEMDEAIQDIPVQYYEAKPQRYVKPSEAYIGMILPEDQADPRIIDWLEKRDLPYKIVPKGLDTDEMRAEIEKFTEEHPELRWSLADNTDNESLNAKLRELSDTGKRLERIVHSSELTERVRQTAAEELVNTRSAIDALRVSYGMQRIYDEPGSGQIINIPDARVSTPEDLLNAILQTDESNQTRAEILNRAYRRLGYEEGARPEGRRQWKQSQLNTNTYSKIIDGFLDEIIQNEEDEHARALMASTAARLKDEGQYQVITNKESVENARRRLKEDFDGERRRFEESVNNRNEWGAEDIDVAMGLLAVDLASRDPEQFMHTAELIRKKGTKAGQLIQAFKKYSQTPEGVLVEALADLNKAKLNPDKKKQLITAMQDLAQTLDSLKNNDMEGLIDVIVRQAELRNTKISKFTLNSLRKSNFQSNYKRAMTQLRMIPRDYIQASAGEKLSTYQVLSHLLNFRTGARNLIANTVFNDIDSLFAHNIAWGVDAITRIFTGQSSIGGPQAGGFLGKKEVMQGAMKGLRESAIDVALDIDPEGRATKYGNSRRTWHMVGNPGAKALSTLEKMLGYELNVTDEFQKGYIYAQTMKELQPLVEKGVITMQDATAAASDDMHYRTFQDDTVVGKFLGIIHDGLNILPGFGDSGKTLNGRKVHAFGAGDLIQKYTTVPGALITRALEFSPVGYLKVIHNIGALYEASKSLKEQIANATDEESRDELMKAQADLFFAQRRFALSAGRATTGTGLIIAFSLLTGLGIMNDEDEGEQTSEKNYETIRGLQGLSGTQLNLDALWRVIDTGDISGAKWESGDHLMDVAFLEPMNSLMAVGSLIAGGDEYTTLKEAFQHAADAGNVWDSTLEGLFNAVADLPTMQSLGSFQQAMQYYDPEADGNKIKYVALEIMSGSLTGFVPAPIRQAAQAQDKYYRDAYSSTDQITQMGDMLRNSIPEVTDQFEFGRESLPTKLTPFGEDKTGEDTRLRALNAFFNPGTMRTYQPTEVYDFLQNMADETGKVNFYPDRNAPRSVDMSIDKVENSWDLTNDERRAYQQLRGQTYQSLLANVHKDGVYNDAMTSSKMFDSLAPEDKALALSNLKSLANYMAKKDFLVSSGKVDAETVATNSSDSSTHETTMGAMELGINPVDWSIYKSTAYNTPGEIDPKTGKTKKNSKKNNVKAYINSLPLTNAQKSYLYLHQGNGYTTDDDWAGK